MNKEEYQKVKNNKNNWYVGNDEIKITKDKQCILCPYKHEDGCLYNHDNCYSLSNIYHGKICKYFPFKQIENFKTERNYKKRRKR